MRTKDLLCGPMLTSKNQSTKTAIVTSQYWYILLAQVANQLTGSSFFVLSFFFYDSSELVNAVRNSYNPAPHVEILTMMFDIRNWMAPARMDIRNISNPHCFVLEENSKGDVVIRYKNWSRDKEWRPSRNPDECITVLQV